MNTAAGTEVDAARERRRGAGRWLAPWLADSGRLFWTLQLSGWSAYGFAYYLGGLTESPGGPLLAVALIAALSGLLLSLGLRYVYRELWLRSPLVIAAGVLASSFVCALVWTLVRNEAAWSLTRPWFEPASLTGHFAGFTESFYVLLCWSGLYFGIKYYRTLQEQTLAAIEATAAAHEAQLTMLRYQLNPHFLFNTLNAISTLVLAGEHELANRCVTRLSEFLRYSLTSDPTRRVTLEQELETLDLYLGIEKVRFEERLDVVLDVEESALKALVPSLLTQPLIENAIKYAVAAKEEGATIRVTARTGKDFLLLKVSDTGPGLRPNHREPGRSSGVGLRNTRERLRQIYGHRFSLTVGEARGGGVVVAIRIPYDTDDAD